MKNAIALSALLAGLSLATAASAQAPPDDFSKLDRNADGRISMDEASPVADLRASFATLDRNHDGLLTPDEFAKWTGSVKPPAKPVDPSTGPSGSGGAQHMPKTP